VIVDSSALVAIIRGEPDGPEFVARIEPNSCKISAASLFETTIVIDAQQSPDGSRALDEFVREAAINVVPFDEQQARLARQAYRDYGKGSGHPAKLNFGDCFAYALAKATGEPLLFKGNDFAHTDVASAHD
jgi:ribonuclease VapC